MSLKSGDHFSGHCHSDNPAALSTRGRHRPSRGDVYKRQTRGGATRGHAGWREALRKILGGYRENGNGICSASDDVFWTGPEF